MAVRLEARERGGEVEVIDHRLGSWVMRLQPQQTTRVDEPSTVPAAAAAVGALAQAMAPINQIIRNAVGTGASIRVAFSPEVQRGIAAGTFTLMQSPKGTLPIAVTQAGRIREIAKFGPMGLVPAPALIPILLPAAIASTAA